MTQFSPMAAYAHPDQAAATASAPGSPVNPLVLQSPSQAGVEGFDPSQAPGAVPGEQLLL